MEVRFPLILDGATGTQLQKRGFDGSVSAEEWVLTHPEVISELQNTYVAAGSRVVYAPTFGANPCKMPSEKVGDYNMRLAAISKAAVGGRAFVAGDMAPTGKFLAPLGEESFEELVAAYTRQAEALALKYVKDNYQAEAELNAIVDQGCTVIDVIVEHPIYGQITGPLELSNRYDVSQFLLRSAQTQPLSVLTEGIHLHTLSCPDEAAFTRVQNALRALGVLLEE